MCDFNSFFSWGIHLWSFSLVQNTQNWHRYEFYLPFFEFQIFYRFLGFKKFRGMSSPPILLFLKRQKGLKSLKPVERWVKSNIEWQCIVYLYFSLHKHEAKKTLCLTFLSGRSFCKKICLMAFSSFSFWLLLMAKAFSGQICTCWSKGKVSITFNEVIQIPVSKVTCYIIWI